MDQGKQEINETLDFLFRTPAELKELPEIKLNELSLERLFWDTGVNNNKDKTSNIFRKVEDIPEQIRLGDTIQDKQIVESNEFRARYFGDFPVE